MVQQFNITRGGKVSQVNIGVTTDKASILYLEDVEADEVLGLKSRWVLGSLFIDTNPASDEGEVTLIKTVWKRKTMAPTGVSIPGFETTEIMITNEEDIKAFITTFGMPILMSMVNGLVRGVWGFNNLPVFNATTGALKVYTPLEEDSAPTNDYR